MNTESIGKGLTLELIITVESKSQSSNWSNICWSWSVVYINYKCMLRLIYVRKLIIYFCKEILILCDDGHLSPSKNWTDFSECLSYKRKLWHCTEETLILGAIIENISRCSKCDLNYIYNLLCTFILYSYEHIFVYNLYIYNYIDI